MHSSTGGPRGQESSSSSSSSLDNVPGMSVAIPIPHSVSCRAASPALPRIDVLLTRCVVVATIPQDGHPPQPLNLTHHRRPSPMARDSSPDSRPPAIPSVAEMPAMTRHRVPAPPSSLDAINTATTFDGQRDNLSPVGISSLAKTLTGSMSACEMPLRARAANETPTSTTAPQSPRM